MTSKAEQGRQDAKLRALRLIEANPEISQRQLASELGISLGATHYILRALVDTGLVKLGRFSASRNKKDYVYILTAKGVSEKAVMLAQFLTRKRQEYDALRQEIELLSAELPRSGESEAKP